MLDVRTAVVVGALHGLLVAVSFVVGRSLHRGVLRIATHRWALGMTVETLGWASMTLRPLLPELVAVVLSNGLTALGVALLADAVRMVLGCRRPPHLRFVVPIAIVACLAPLTWPTSYFHARVSVMSIASALQLFCASVVQRLASPATRWSGSWSQALRCCFCCAFAPKR